jgi:hypothetical protein
VDVDMCMVDEERIKRANAVQFYSAISFNASTHSPQSLHSTCIYMNKEEKTSESTFPIEVDVFLLHFYGTQCISYSSCVCVCCVCL